MEVPFWVLGTAGSPLNCFFWADEPIRNTQTLFYRQDYARQPLRFNLLEVEFSVFRPARATCCTNKGDIWRIVIARVTLCNFIISVSRVLCCPRYSLSSLLDHPLPGIALTRSPSLPPRRVFSLNSYAAVAAASLPPIATNHMTLQTSVVSSAQRYRVWQIKSID